MRRAFVVDLVIDLVITRRVSSPVVVILNIDFASDIVVIYLSNIDHVIDDLPLQIIMHGVRIGIASRRARASSCLGDIKVNALHLRFKPLTCQICGYFFVNMHVKLLSPEAFFQAKMQQISTAAGLRLDPLGELTALPRPLACPTFKGRGG